MNHEEKHVSNRRQRRAVSAGATAALMVAAGLIIGPAGAANAQTAPAESCVVTGAELRWGVKESFRNYISGSIANGEWTTENGASYETPAFSWPNGEGTVAPELESGSVKFTGDVHFTGHGGLMKLDIRDPELVFTGSDSAQLVLGMGSTDTEEAELTYERVVAGKVDLSGYDAGDGSTLSIPSAQVRLTAEGAAALNGDYGDYVAGAEVDPLSLTMSVSGCSLASSTGAQPPAEEAETPAPETPEVIAPAPEQQIPWIPIIIGGVALIAIGVTSGMLIADRRKNSGAESSAEAPEDSAE
ncbi:Htaa protein [Leucobacter komagatae]|uniref:Htaa protein n=1 Tax=Leucobacter komagatae TaxID=55969 RepID=A0A542Y6M8_9MICO|nr:Htaa protein [Leucobacter komagatae]